MSDECSNRGPQSNQNDEFKQIVDEVITLSRQISDILARPSVQAWLLRVRQGLVALHHEVMAFDSKGYVLKLESMGKTPAEARFVAKSIAYLAPQLAECINLTRQRLQPVIIKLAKASSNDAFAIASELSKLTYLVPYLQGLNTITTDDLHENFCSLVDRAVAGDNRSAMEELIERCRALRPYIRSGGRPVSIRTCHHALWLDELNGFGQKVAYTYNAYDAVSPYNDPVTLATMAELELSRFDPRPGLRLFRQLLAGA